MNPYNESLKAFLAQNELNFGSADVHSAWQMLYWCYMQHNPICTEGIRAKLLQLEECTTRLSLEENDRVAYLISDLCLMHEQEAFYAGLRLGLCLINELMERELV